MSHLRQIMIGDYADITYDNDNEIYRYYLIKIETDKIDIAEATNPSKILTLIKIEDDWKIEGYDNPHIITFNKNATTTQYFERDFTQAPTYILIEDSSRTFPDSNEKIIQGFAEIKNGIILYQSGFSGNMGFFDPDDINTFLEVPIFKNVRFEYEYDIINISDEIFNYSFIAGSLVKLNLDDLTMEEYDKVRRFTLIIPLKNKKILFLLQDMSMYIFNVPIKEKIYIDVAPLQFNDFPKIFQLSNGDIIFNYFYRNRHSIEFYQVDINNGKIIKIASFNDLINIIAILPDDKFLLHNVTSKILQIWDPVNNQFTDISPLVTKDNKAFSILLQNGDVLFYRNKFYLFQHETQTLIHLPLLENGYTDITMRDYLRFQQLQNGNLLISNGKYLTIMEFPVNQQYYDKLNFDKISSTIREIPPDLKNLIRSYL